MGFGILREPRVQVPHRGRLGSSEDTIPYISRPAVLLHALRQHAPGLSKSPPGGRRRASVNKMLKFSGNNRQTGKPVLGIGLTRENCEDLLLGNPIKIDLGDGDRLPVLSLVIFAGETDEDMTKAMLDGDAIRPEQVKYMASPKKKGAN